MQYRPTPPDRKPRSVAEGLAIAILVGAMATAIGIGCGPWIAGFIRSFQEMWTFTQ